MLSYQGLDVSEDVDEVESRDMVAFVVVEYG